MTDPSPYADRPYAAADPGNTFSLVAIVLGLLGAAACPVLLGPAAVGVSSVAMTKGERLWPLALAVSVVGVVGGLALWIFAFGQVAPFMG